MNKNKLFLSLVAVFLISTLVVFAYFISQSTSSDNTITSGSIIIGAPNTGDNVAIVTATDLLPGGNTTGTVTVNNLGSSPFKYAITATNTTPAGDDLFNALNVVISQDGTEIYNGLVSNLDQTLINANLAVLGSETLDFNVSLPTTAGSAVQGLSANIQFAFDATQIDNPGWTE